MQEGKKGKKEKEGGKPRLRRSAREVDQIADRLVATFGNPERQLYYCRVAWRLSEATIWRSAEQASRGREPAKLFTWLVQQEMGR